LIWAEARTGLSRLNNKTAKAVFLPEFIPLLPYERTSIGSSLPAGSIDYISIDLRRQDQNLWDTLKKTCCVSMSTWAGLTDLFPFDKKQAFEEEQ
jgi:hypothetical protein